MEFFEKMFFAEVVFWSKFHFKIKSKKSELNLDRRYREIDAISEEIRIVKNRPIWFLSL